MKGILDLPLPAIPKLYPFWFVYQQLQTRTFRKQSAANTLLLASSHHPLSLIRGIPIGRLFCICRNCLDEVGYRSETEDLYWRFRNRGYSHKTIWWAWKRASSSKQENLIRPSVATPSSPNLSPVRIITRYGSQWNEVRSILAKDWHILNRSNSLSQIAGSRPLLVSRRARNLRDNMVHSEFVCSPTSNWLSEMSWSQGMFPCGHCHIYWFVERTSTFTDADEQKVYSIKHFINWSTSRVLYILECPCKRF